MPDALPHFLRALHLNIPYQVRDKLLNSPNRLDIIFDLKSDF
jgi:hypothetical protein